MAVSPEIVQAFRAQGVRPSPQRIAVLELLQSVTSHPTAEQLHASLLPRYPTLSRTTVYQTLDLLCELGLARQVAGLSAEKHYDGNVARHGHFRCSRCDRLFDFPVSTPLPVPGSGFYVTEAQVVCTGICPACQHSDKHHPAQVGSAAL